MTKRAFDTPETQAGRCFLCLATCVSYVMKQGTQGGSVFALVRARSPPKTVDWS
jgi:hypothetical protein